MQQVYKVTYEPLLDGGFQVRIPAISARVEFARTLDGARVVAHDTIASYLAGKDPKQPAIEPCTPRDSF